MRKEIIKLDRGTMEELQDKINNEVHESISKENEESIKKDNFLD